MTHGSAPTPLLIGRQAERAELRHALQSGRPQLIALYGRRRVGKTYLIRTFFEQQLCFELTGVRGASLSQQLANFARALERATQYPLKAPRDWAEAFQELIRYLPEPLRHGPKVVFFDELPWLAARRSGFLPAFEHFWNSWGSRQNNLLVVICGSAASWMIAKVLHQKGGLHNRVTLSTPLHPFTLHETEAFLQARGMQLDRKQIIELAMALGGIPYYLDYVRKGRSAAQNIEALFFAPNAPLHDEFAKLFAALFEHHERHVKVIRALARKQSGLSRQELAAATGLTTGGNMSIILSELETSGFICSMTPFGRAARDKVHRLVDELTLFHLRWMDGKRQHSDGAGRWMRIHATPAWHAWSGYAFENLCFQHIAQLKQALGISGVQTETSSWRHQPSTADETGAQIDLVIDRRDGVINLCEMKFSNGEFVIDKKYAGELRTKLDTFRRVTRTRKSLFLTMVTTHGVKPNDYQMELVQNSVTADALFVA
jgi:hypothetical protein